MAEKQFAKKVLKRQLIINAMMQMQTNNCLIKEWNIIQDMENLFYMSTTLIKENLLHIILIRFPILRWLIGLHEHPG